MRRRVQRSYFLAVAAMIAALAPAAPVGAWWSQGHGYITSSALQHLPLPLRGLFANDLAYLVSRASSEPSGKHYIDIDYYPEFLAGTFPRDRNELIARYGAATVEAYGMGPWTYVDLLNSLSQRMATAQSAADWRLAVRTAADMAHYIEDLHNPLHLTLNYDGGMTGNSGIHARYEGEMVLRHLDELTIETNPAVYLPSPTDFVFDGIELHYPHVAEILAADTLARPLNSPTYYDKLWAETGEFTHVLFQEASEAVASSWYTAWIYAGSPRWFLLHAADFQADGDVDGEDLPLWSEAFGLTTVADANGDGATDGHDLLLWQLQLTGTAGRTVPEPASWLLAGMALAISAVRRGTSAAKWDGV